MNIVFTPTSWKQYTDWQKEDKKQSNELMNLSKVQIVMDY